MAYSILNHPYELVLAKENNEVLQRRIRKLNDEVLQLKAYIIRNNLPLPGVKQPIAYQPINGKGFLDTTVVSRNRSAQSGIQTVFQQEKPTSYETIVFSYNGYDSKYPWTKFLHKYKYEDANLVRVGGKPHYMEPTQSSGNRSLGRPRAIQKLTRKLEAPRTPEECRDDEGQDQQEESISDEEANWNHPVDGLLKKRSGLKRKVPDHLQYVPIRSQFLYRVLQQSLNLAQEVFFYGIKDYMPYFSGQLDVPQEARFGFKELNSFFNNCWDGTFEVAGMKRYRQDLRWKLLDVTALRNQVCHYSPNDAAVSLKRHDKLIKYVQVLAIFFADERRAFRARALRDKLIAHAEQCLHEFEGMLILAELPGARPWEGHHIRKFKRIVNGYYPNSDFRSIPPAILRAANDWNLRRPDPHWEWPPEDLTE
ncbi:hypothetical protein F5Y11DRAFT_364085 [Daldinia sp. FL1419]|nr:hypothetical protein F5Y11DRAFT_364085 [Daldinia sp. FL1419]